MALETSVEAEGLRSEGRPHGSREEAAAVTATSDTERQVQMYRQAQAEVHAYARKAQAEREERSRLEAAEPPKAEEGLASPRLEADDTT